jgi:hypothetical protein
LYLGYQFKGVSELIEITYDKQVLRHLLHHLFYEPA